MEGELLRRSSRAGTRRDRLLHREKGHRRTMAVRLVAQILKTHAAVLAVVVVAVMAAPRAQQRPTGFLFDDLYLRHLAGDTGHPERPERLTAIRNGLERSGLLRTLVA